MKQKTLALIVQLGLILLSVPAFATRSAASQPNRLVTAKVIYVEPMPNHLDQWIIMDLRAWGRYRIASSEAGVDLVIRAKEAEKKVHFTRRERPPVLQRKHTAPPVLAVTAVDWVSGAMMWQADILNTGLKKNHIPPAGPETKIDARHLKPDQIAERCVNLLRQYVESLKQAAPAKP